MNNKGLPRHAESDLSLASSHSDEGSCYLSTGTDKPVDSTNDDDLSINSDAPLPQTRDDQVPSINPARQRGLGYRKVTTDDEGEEGSEEKTEEKLKGTDEEEVAEGGPVAKKKSKKSMGTGTDIQDRNVFALESLSNSYIRSTTIIVNILFVFMIVFTNVIDLATTSNKVDLYTRVNDTSLCSPKEWPSDPCLPHPYYTSEQAALLSNTVLVSDGINASQWDGNGAVESTNPFVTFNNPGAFITDPSVLEKSANPELHKIWNNITSVIWFGLPDKGDQNHKKSTIELTFTRTGGKIWPKSAEDEIIPVSIKSFGCMRGDDCTSVGNWRWMVIGNKETKLKREKSGTVLTTKLFIYTYLLGDIRNEAEVLRIVTSDDPGGVISASLAQDFVITSVTHVTQTNNLIFISFFKLVIFILFLACYVAWFIYLTVHVGSPKKWPKENLWLLIIATGTILESGIGHISINFQAAISTNFKFNESSECATIVLSYFGYTMVLFGFFCFNDGPRRFIAGTKEFYPAKVLYSFIYFFFATVFTIFRFPKVSGLDEAGTDTVVGGLGYVTSIESLSTKDQRVLLSLLSITYGLQFLALAWFVGINIQTRRLLKELPYGMTRPTQISHSYFTWMITLVITVRAVTLIVSIVEAIENDINYSVSSTSSGLSATLFALDSISFIRNVWDAPFLLFLCVFNLFYMRMFLPPSTSEIFSSRTHYRSEEELSAALKKAHEEDEDDDDDDIEDFIEGHVVLNRARLLCVCSREVYLPMTEKERIWLTGNEDKEQRNEQTGLGTQLNDFIKTNVLRSKSFLGLETEGEETEKFSDDFVSDKSTTETSRGDRKLMTGRIKPGLDRPHDNTVQDKVDTRHTKPKINKRTNPLFVDMSSDDEDNVEDSTDEKLPDDDEMSSDAEDGIQLVTRHRRLLHKVDSFVEFTHCDITGESTKMRIAGSPPERSLHNQTGCTYTMGCRVVARIQEPELASFHDNTCIILRHEQSGDLIIAFRGTLTMKQNKTNLMMTPRITLDLDKFLATTPPKHRKYLEEKDQFNMAYVDALTENLRTGQVKNIKRLTDLLPRAEMDTMPDYLESAVKDDIDINGTGNVHRGQWSSYNRLRKEIHRIVRKELLRQPSRILVTGHSLGGAIGTLCSYDMARWVIPTVKRELSRNRRMYGNVSANNITLSHYSFGSPKVGGYYFVKAYNKLVPNTFRIVCDGDIITAWPSFYLGYIHVGRSIVIDKYGSIVVSPSLIEKRLALAKRTQGTSHMTTSYAAAIKSAYIPIDTEEEMLNLMKIGYKNNAYKAFVDWMRCIK